MVKFSNVIVLVIALLVLNLIFQKNIDTTQMHSPESENSVVLEDSTSAPTADLMRF